MPVKRALLACAAALLALGAAACGEDTNHNDPRSVLHTFYRATLDRDARTACDLMTPDGRKLVVRLFSGSSCRDSYATALRHTPSSEFEKLRNLKIKKIEIAKDTALVTSTDPDDPIGVMRRIDGHWRVDITPAS